MRKINEIMTREVITISPHDTLQTAARKMRDYDIGFLPFTMVTNWLES